MISWEYICLFLAIGYALLILIYFVGWLLIRERKKLVQTEPKNKFTILIPARNEAEQIGACLNDILKQNYPPNLFEIVVINDHSTDTTEAIIREWMGKENGAGIRLINSSEMQVNGKKESISMAIELANNPYIILTDADCTRGKNWLQSIDSYLQEKSVKMLYAPVCFGANNVFEKIQSLEFAGLVGIGGAAIRLKNPNMCSAANLIFTKEAFLSVNGYQDNAHIASGDDEFLLHKIFKKFPNEVFFLKDKEAIVYTSPNASVEQLSQQRRRWVSKSTKYEERYITAILVGAYFYNLSMLLNFVLGFFMPGLFFILGIQLGIKILVEGMFLFSVLSFFEQRKLIFLILLAEPFHILYVIIIGIWANTQTYTWKERELK
ncbi:MAG: glycosyltransferase [Bacteroidia bacterium]|nr:glycosyltransferase [Bacteroidia bacterium]MCF8446407.1 glycosyltransferase [Bacteroidia bacterium]